MVLTSSSCERAVASDAPGFSGAPRESTPPATCQERRIVQTQMTNILQDCDNRAEERKREGEGQGGGFDSFVRYVRRREVLGCTGESIPRTRDQLHLLAEKLHLAIQLVHESPQPIERLLLLHVLARKQHHVNAPKFRCSQVSS